MNYSTLKYFSVLVSLLFVFTMPANSSTARTYDWADISQSLALNGGHKLKNGELITKVYIPAEVISSRKSIKLHTSYSGRLMHLEKFVLRINDVSPKITVRPVTTIKTRFLNPGINKIKFVVLISDLYDSWDFSSENRIVINQLSFSGFDTQLVVAQKENKSVVNLEAPKRVVSGGRSKSNAYDWTDLNQSLSLDGGHKLSKRELKVKINIPGDVIASQKALKLHTDFSGRLMHLEKFVLRINEVSPKIAVRPVTTIKTRFLRPGINEFKFVVLISDLYDSWDFSKENNIVVRQLSFSGFAAPMVVAQNKKKAPRKMEIPKPAATAVPKPVVTEVAPQAPAPTTPTLQRSQNAKKNRDSIAVVIGNQIYEHKDIPSVAYAQQDAAAIRQYLIDTLAYRDGNIIYAEDVSKTGLEKIFGTEKNHRGMLYNYIKPEKSDVFIYYSGHGAPDPVTNEAYLVPSDCDPVMMSLTAYPLNVLYGNLPKIEANNVIVVIDSCFSGGTNTGQWLVPNASPAMLRVKNPVSTREKVTIFTSAENNQVSSWYPEKQHSMFTYFFLKAVSGGADFDNDRRISFQEIYDFVADRSEGVPYYAKRLHGGRIQTPTMLAADKNAVFVSYE